MDQKTLVDAVREIFIQYDHNKNGYSLLMLYKQSLEQDKWNIAFSAKWLDRIALRKIIFDIKTALSENEALNNMINQVFPLQTNSAFVNHITSAVSVSLSEPSVPFNNITLNGALIPVSIILGSSTPR